jgi:uncharacterized protein
MSLSMYQASVPVLIRALQNLQGILDKGAAHAKAKGVDEVNYTSMRLVPDMFPLSRQVQIVCDVAKAGVSRLAGVEPPAHPDTETTFDQLKARCQAVIDYLHSFKPEQIDGSEDKDIVIKTPHAEKSFKGQPFLFGFVLANAHFHSTTTYTLLRGIGVDVGKDDYIGLP